MPEAVGAGAGERPARRLGGRAGDELRACLRTALDSLPRNADDDGRQARRWRYARRALTEAQPDLQAWLGRWAARDPRLTDGVEAHLGETLPCSRGSSIRT